MWSIVTVPTQWRWRNAGCRLKRLCPIATACVYFCHDHRRKQHPLTVNDFAHNASPLRHRLQCDCTPLRGVYAGLAPLANNQAKSITKERRILIFLLCFFAFIFILKGCLGVDIMRLYCYTMTILKGWFPDAF